MNGFRRGSFKMLYEFRLIACASMLALAAIIDFKKREIPDKIWVIFGSLGAVITAFELFAMPTLFFDSRIADHSSSPAVSISNLMLFGIQIGITVPIAYLVYRTGLFGGADSKALIAIALLFPFYAAPLKLHELSALTILTNAAILSMSHVLYNVVRNLASLIKGKRIFDGFERDSIGRKALAMMMGYRTESSNNGYVFSMEVAGDDAGKQRKFNFSPASYEEYVGSGKKDIWVTTALPFIVYMAAGFVIMISFGDIIASIFLNLL
jgi:archaeal preflagellin peptidase FlaK